MYICELTACPDPVSWLDGKSFEGWERSIGSFWKIEDVVLTTPTLSSKQARNNLLSTRKAFQNFALSLR
jgi:hypothetical protein